MERSGTGSLPLQTCLSAWNQVQNCGGKNGMHLRIDNARAPRRTVRANCMTMKFGRIFLRTLYDPV